MKHRWNATIGIPAYNEESNIFKLLKNLTTQKLTDLEITKVLIVSDCSTDNTVREVQKLGLRKVKIIENEARLGKAMSLNKVIEEADTDILILLDADILPAGDTLIAELVKPILEGSADFTCAAQIPQSPETFFEKILYAGDKMKRKAFESHKSGNNLFACQGTARAFSKEFYRSFRFPTSIGEDMQAYLFCVTKGFRFKRVSEAVVYFKLPDNFKDHEKQSLRFFNSTEYLNKFFDKDVVENHTSFPILNLAKSALTSLAESHIYLLLYLFVAVFLKLKSLLFKSQHEAWAVALSSKKFKETSSI